MRLNVGCGSQLKNGYVNIDLYHPDAEVRDDARTLATFADGCATEVHASHVLEHLGKYEGPQALAAWHRVLQPGGKLVLHLPDIPQMVRLWLEFYDRHDPRVWEFRSMTLWGNQVHAGEFHKWGYDAQSLRQALVTAGFHDIVIRYEDGLDTDFGTLANACLYAEAIA